ncbi:MAG: DTW domain-containing protein [Candidatus Brocadiaceae bacterium]|nr:DTW domain-containing protein [Candidatus Brocadiaceae bacterium]
MIVQDCICPENCSFRTEHKITLLTTRKEERIASNTGILLRLMLENISLIYVGDRGWEREVLHEISREEYTPVILFPIHPFRDGKEIIQEKGKPLNIFVLDTNWKGARRWVHKPAFMPLQKIGLQTVPPSAYYLRKQFRESNLCTFQAVTSLLLELGTEGFDSVFSCMHETFTLWVKSLARERGMKLPQ